MIETLTNFHNFAKQQFGLKQNEILLPQTDKVTTLQHRIYPEGNLGISAQIAKGVFLLGGTVCSALAAIVLFGKRVGEVGADTDVIEGHLGRRLLAVPQVKTTLAPVSIFPTNPMVTVISMFDLFFDSDGQDLALEVVEKGKQTIPSWMVLNKVGALYGLATYDTPGVAYDVHVVGDLAYVADGSSLQIIDVSDPSLPQLKGTYNTPGIAYGVHVVGNLAYVADASRGLQIIDVSNPSSPTLKGNYSIPGQAYNGVYVAQNLAYITARANGLQIINISNPSSPKLKGNYTTPGHWYNGVYVAQNLAYIADNGNGLQIIDVSNPSSPKLKGNYTNSGQAQNVYVVGNVTYMTDGSYGLQIIDVSNPSSPKLKSTYNTLGAAYGVHVAQNLAYIADGPSGLTIIDVSNPNSPILKGTYDTPGTAYDVDVVGNFVYVADYINGLQIIEQRFTLTGTPNQTHVGNYEIELIAKDPDQNQISQILRVRVEGPPVTSGTIPNQLINVNLPFTYFIDQSVFSDPNGDVIFYSSKLEYENSLPSWLSFSSIGIFSGSPTSSDVGVYSIKVLAFDRIVSQEAEATFSLSVDHFPQVITTISDHAADIGKLYNYTVPINTFNDADIGDILTYNATLSNGAPLPSWLSFNALLFSGTPSAANAGSLSIKLSATDLALAKTQTSFTLHVENFPTLVNALPNQLAGVGQSFTFVIPSNTYRDLDGDALIYKVTKSDGSILPSWLKFNTLTQEFQGTPVASDKGLLALKVIAEDPYGGQAATTFNLNVINSLGEKVARIDDLFVYVIPNNMINNPLGPITYTVTLEDGSPLPTWAAFDPVNAVISGTPPSTSQGEYILLVTANDGVQTPALASLNLRVGINAAPQVANSISNQVAQVNQKYRFVVPDNTFIDPNGDPLTLSAFGANGRGLPTWLKFDPATRTLAGKPGRGDTGAFSDKALPLQICATDGYEKICSVFDLSVQGTSNEERALSIFGPLGSAAAIGLAWYKKRGLFVNPFNKSYYDKGTRVVSTGQPLTYKLDAEVNKVKLVQAFQGRRTLAGIPVPKSLDEKGWFEWLKHDKAIPGGDLLPSWLSYDERKNELTTHFNSYQKYSGLFVVRVYGNGGVILEEIKLDLGGQENKNVEMTEI